MVVGCNERSSSHWEWGSACVDPVSGWAQESAATTPAALKVVTQLFKRRIAHLAIGIFNSGSMVGVGLNAPPIIVYLLQHHGYRSFSCSGIAWSVMVPLWWLIYRDPVSDPVGNLEVPRRGVRELFRLPTVWAVMMCRFFVGPVMQFYWYWIPNYLFHERHLTMSEIGYVAWLPFVLGDNGGVAGGWGAVALQQRGYTIHLQVRKPRRCTPVL